MKVRFLRFVYKKTAYTGLTWYNAVFLVCMVVDYNSKFQTRKVDYNIAKPKANVEITIIVIIA